MSSTVRASDGAALHAVVTGDGPTTVVLAHGWALGIATWQTVAERLAGDGFRVVCFDQRGHGRSELGDADAVSVPQLGLDLAAVIEQLRGGRPVVLVAHSMGGMATMAMVRQRPDLLGEVVQAVALVSTSAGDLRRVGLLMPRPLRPIASRSIAPVMAHIHARTRDKSSGLLVRLADRLTRRSTFGPAAEAAQVAAARQLIAATEPQVILGYGRAMAVHDERESLQLLRRIPVRVLVGSRDLMTPVAHARQVAQASHGRLEVVPDAGHMLHIEAPDVVVDAVRGLADARPRERTSP